MADTTMISISIPDEPPDRSVVLAGGAAGDAWQRDDGMSRRRRESNWFPAVARVVNDEFTRDPMPWRHLIAQYGAVIVLRTGDGREEAIDA